MVTEQFIRTRFIHDVLVKDVGLIYSTQEEIVNTYLQQRSGQLSSYMSRPSFSESDSDSGVKLTMRVLAYLRFLDINSAGHGKRKDRVAKYMRTKLALYNRTVWGVLYRETFPRMRYGLSQDIRKAMLEEFQTALNQ